MRKQVWGIQGRQSLLCTPLTLFSPTPLYGITKLDSKAGGPKGHLAPKAVSHNLQGRAGMGLGEREGGVEEERGDREQKDFVTRLGHSSGRSL